MYREFKNILVLAPHTDDGELGCGASIVKFIESGATVFYVAFSTAEESLRKELPKNTLELEVREATNVLGIKSSNLIIKKYPVRKFSSYRQEILEELVILNKEILPDLVLIPSIRDLHQDHAVIANEALRAFKRISIISYEIPWNNIDFTTNCFLIIDEKHLQTKIDALKCYKSQSHRDYLGEEFIRSLAITRGVQIGVKYAELFEIVRWIIK